MTGDLVRFAKQRMTVLTPRHHHEHQAQHRFDQIIIRNLVTDCSAASRALISHPYPRLKMSLDAQLIRARRIYAEHPFIPSVSPFVLGINRLPHQGTNRR